MERKLHSRLVGILLVTGAVMGLVISLSGLGWLWSSKAKLARSLTGTVALFGSALSATHETINVIGTSLDQAGADLKLVNTMIDDVARSLEESSGMISSTGELIGTDLVGLVTNTQASLAAVQNSAKAIDSILSKITAVPLVGGFLGNGYNPEVPLQASVAEVSRSLDPLPGSLVSIRRDLAVASANVATVKAEVQTLGKQVGAIQTSIEDARKVVDRYREVLDEVQTRYDAFEERLPGMIDMVAIGVSAILVWILITQVGMMMLGVERLRGSRQ